MIEHHYFDELTGTCYAALLQFPSYDDQDKNLPMLICALMVFFLGGVVLVLLKLYA